MSAIAQIHCNNYYVSCERVFDVALVGIPVVVASNDDGCTIADRDDRDAVTGIILSVIGRPNDLPFAITASGPNAQMKWTREFW